MRYAENLSTCKVKTPDSPKSMERRSRKDRNKSDLCKTRQRYKNPLCVEEKIKYVLSYGGGVNSTALLFHLVNNKAPLDLVIFSDTGNELPETYETIKEIKVYCKNKDIDFVTVHFGYGLFDIVKPSLYAYCYARKLIPSRMFRWCSYKFKIRPIKKYLKTLGETIQYIGFASDESKRAKYKDNLYPLIAKNITRKGCIDIIKDEGFNIPVKSGCFICPYQTVKSWRDLYLNHKDLFDKAEFLENNCSNKKVVFALKPLRELKSGFGYNSNKIDDYIIPPCESGYCFT